MDDPRCELRSNGEQAVNLRSNVRDETRLFRFEEDPERTNGGYLVNLGTAAGGKIIKNARRIFSRQTERKNGAFTGTEVPSEDFHWDWDRSRYVDRGAFAFQPNLSGITIRAC